MKLIDGGICAVKGVMANGIKQGKNGLAIIAVDAPGLATAGVFTRNKVIAAPLIVTRQALKEYELNGIIANSGCANAFTGERGIQDAQWMAGILAKNLRCKPEEIGVASTGVIGRYLDKKVIAAQLEDVFGGLSNTKEASKASARAIMTTDTTMKEVAVELDNGAHIGGIAKGSGMIEPNMGTMLVFLYTDAALSKKTLDSCLRKAVDRSFNMVVVDGDTSTNDMALVTATGYHECEEEAFQEGLDHVCIALAKMIARDGEGATRLIEARVTGACTHEDARLAAKAIVRSPLVKTAIFGKDPNWGRVVAAAGYSGAEVEQDKISLKFSNNEEEVALVSRGKIVEGKLEALKSIMAGEEIIIEVALGLGDNGAVAWGCDLTYDYVKINAMYTT
ncbi:bifunctional ornithine acetyltransferase/N-acetylglutamate synthase [Candidatus Methanoperedens nitratireducens]|uniref:Glutamate N-acetyltransferase n=1 Tax=Candidatus Methanoperedens nitratireducens TaxID=1392998 RepID=A0A284VI29_9EURY|nr:bifunctional ornithine acetyltransferase/N-acetylglutamate synthase [Candidatus Methanoperedens nitroreducens]SNQ58916.1 Arginine biosynthesis bifunctional protein ArgJ (Includes: Glutamate N-acetyltransferase; Amino-acid acetyltransferase) [Candidatus Methanoperedens nitroreducens]